MKKPRAYEFGEGGPGLFTVGAYTAAEAVKAMRDWWNEDPKYHLRSYDIDPSMFSESNVKYDTLYYHRVCSTWTIGENWCIECGEQTKGSGRMTWTIFFGEKDRA